MTKTWGILGVGIGVGTMLSFAAERTLFNITALGLNAYNTFGVPNDLTQAAGAGLDFYDLTRTASPLSIISLTIYGTDLYINRR